MTKERKPKKGKKGEDATLGTASTIPAPKPPATKRSSPDPTKVRAEAPANAPRAEDAIAAARAFLKGDAPKKRPSRKPPPRVEIVPESAKEAKPAAPTSALHPTMPPAPTSPTPIAEASLPAAIPIERPSDEEMEPVTIDAETRRRPPVAPASTPEMIAEEIRQLEERLDRMIDEASRSKLPTADVPATPPPPTYPPPAPSSRAAAEAETVFDTARELLSTDFYLRKWGRLGMRNRSEEVDDFGFDPTYEDKLRPFFDFLYERWFRVEPEGVDKIPAEGRCLLVANHSGTLPFDGAMLRTAVKREHPKRRDVRWLAEDFIFHFPFLGAFSNRLGAVRACQENAERLLRQEALVAVFPEGVKGIGKLYRDRYKLQRFGRGGFIKLCLRTGTPIVPVAIVGAEETNPMLLRIEQFSKALGLPYIPVTPTFPALGPLGLVPAPTKWRIVVGDAIPLEPHGPEAADDEILVGRLAERVRATIQQMLERALAGRRSVWFG
jgi:1-acyl-sn-glycerol-3-phosphate acyltransferase